MDGFFGIGIFELVMIAIVALIVLGPDRLPGAMREVAKYMRQLRQISGEFQSQFSEELQMLDELNPKRIISDAIDPKSPDQSKKSTGAKSTATKMSQPRLKAPPKPPVPVENLEEPGVGAESAGSIVAAGDSASGAEVVNSEPVNSILPPAKAPTPAVDPTPSGPNGKSDAAAAATDQTASSAEEPR